MKFREISEENFGKISENFSDGKFREEIFPEIFPRIFRDFPRMKSMLQPQFCLFKSQKSRKFREISGGNFREIPGNFPRKTSGNFPRIFLRFLDENVCYSPNFVF